MKKLFRLLSIIILGIASQGCGNDKDPFEDGNHRFGKTEPTKFYTFHISMGGDYVDQSEEPLVRASDTPNTYVGINVTRKKKNDNDAISENYAYAVFNRRNDISIDLLSGYTYDFETVIIEENTDKLFTKNGLMEPFWTWLSNDTYELNEIKNPYPLNKLNEFQYSYNEANHEYISDLKYGLTRINEGITSAFPRVHRYYAKTPNIDPSSITDGNIIINLEYKCFGLKAVAKNIPAETYVTWKDITEYERSTDLNIYHLKFPENLKLGMSTYDEEITSNWEDIYSLYQMTGDGATTFKLRFTWHKGQGATESFDKDITIHPKYRKILEITISGDPITSSSGNIILKEDDDSRVLTDETQDITNN